jgi:hypothetical protein
MDTIDIALLNSRAKAGYVGLERRDFEGLVKIIK